MKLLRLFVLIVLCVGCETTPTSAPEKTAVKIDIESIQLDIDQANTLAELPLKCITNPLPYKSGLTIAEESDLQMPIVHHPAFYGCFDWHSAVHGHWSLIYLLKEFPDLEKAEEIRNRINQNITEENILKEIEYFSLNKYTANFERTYGWAWLLKLSEELHDWEDPDGQKWYNTLNPLCDLIARKYIDYLPKLVYPIRVGEHTNTAFGLTFAWDWAHQVGHDDLKLAIESRAREFYHNDVDCPISWEPSGYDFLSPCLEELDLMRRVLPNSEFEIWAANFLPEIMIGRQQLKPAEIIDRSDGKLVHLDGLNFSRAWCLYPLQSDHLTQMADEHLGFSLGKIADGDYAGEHWLASFALYALKMRGNN